MSERLRVHIDVALEEADAYAAPATPDTDVDASPEDVLRRRPRLNVTIPESLEARLRELRYSFGRLNVSNICVRALTAELDRLDRIYLIAAAQDAPPAEAEK